MHDYQLERLNTRSFEQMVQALAAELMGPRLMVFGDGPDGGREATFDGVCDCPPSKKKWKGRGTLQAKFRQEPDSEPRKNADWAIEQLKAEFKKLAPRPRSKKKSTTSDRVCPEYYIFATNVRLSSVTSKGGKDRVRVLLDSFKTSHGLKDYAIWDGDQIRRFLDAKPGVRTTFTAWLLPGDVLSEMMKVLQLEQSDFPSTIRRYLESELLDDQFARLGQGGYTDAKNIPLCSVFVDVPIEPPNAPGAARRRTFLDVFFDEGRQVLKPSTQLQAERGRFDARAGRVVLIGGPGQGKTTVGQHACQLLRAELLASVGGPFSPEVERALERIKTMSQGLPQICARRYPLRVDLKNLAAALAIEGPDRATNLFNYLLRRIASRTNSTVKPDQFRKWLGGYPWLLVLDGLDEVPASSNRQQLMQAVRDFISVEAQGADADLLVLATTRPQGYSDEFDPSLYRHLSLAPLNGDEALTYGSLLASARHPGQRTRFEELTNALKRATHNPATVRLMQSPLQVTIMLALIEGGGEPPEQRWKLFHDYYHVIYRREKERGTAYSTILGRYEPDIHWIHKRAGWLLQQRNAEPGRTGDRLTHNEFEAMADARLIGGGHDDAVKRRDLVVEIRKAATDRLVLLVGNTEKEIGFEIRSLQEFMAAEHCFDGGERCVQETLHATACYGYWRNVFLFAAGRIFFERQELIDTVYGVMSEMNEEPADTAQRRIFAGSRLALAVLKDGAARNQPGATRVIARCAARALDAHDDEATSDFGDVFAGDAEDVLKGELARRLNQSGESFPHQNWFLCFLLAAAEKTWARDLTNAFPWQGERVRDFISRYGDLLPDTFWFGLAPYFFNHPLWVYEGLMGRQQEIPKAMRAQPFFQFFELLNLSSQHSSTQFIDVRIAETVSGISIRGVGFALLDTWAKLDYTEVNQVNHDSAWDVYQAVSAFARDPTQSNLVVQLTAIESSDSGDGRGFRKYMPWQLAIPIAAHEAGIAWEEIVRRVSAGYMGDHNDWDRWEGQWRAGLPLSQFRAPDENTVSDQFKGLIFRTGSWMLDGRAKIDTYAAALGEALLQFPDMANKETFVDVCCLGLTNLRGRTISQEVLARFVEACDESSVPPSADIIIAILGSPIPLEEKRRLIGVAGRHILRPGCYGFDRMQSLDTVLAQKLPELLSSPDPWNVLRALSFLPPLSAFAQIQVALLEALALKGGAYSDAAVILKSASLRWSIEEAPELVRRITALSSVYPMHPTELLNFIESGGMTSPHLETFLVEVMKQATSARDAELLAHATSLLVKLVDRRPPLSTLPDPAARPTARVFA